jgi:shikimate kinase
VPAGHLVLVGLMGVGKSTVGRALAARLGRPFVDTDAMVEARAGRSVRDIFAQQGEAAFRDLESEVLHDVLGGDEPLVVAAAGGVVLREQNRAELRRRADRVVWLRADPALLVERVRAGGHRPLLDDDPEGTLRRLESEREPLYREVADAVVSVDGRTVHEVVEAVLR